ncbi:MAG: MFS transporter [Candidatus Eremiobacteraeota bacterium]|nr:MFS transporter [Candidatus Eremiobacteraeota bacterium]
MSARTTEASPLRLAAFWLGIQAVWGALLGISLQARTIELAGPAAMVAYGHLATYGAIVAAVVQIAVGPLSDRLRRRGSRRIEFYLVGATIAAAALVEFYLAPALASLTAAFLVLQAGMNVAIGPYQAIIPDVVGRERYGVASSWMAALQSAGNALGALAASFINDARALGGALAGLLLATAAITSAHVRQCALEPVPEVQPLRIDRPFVDLFVSRALVYVGFYTLLGYLLFYVSAVLHAPSLPRARFESGVLILAFTVVGVIGAAAAARPSDRIDKRLVAAAGGIVVAVALAVFIGGSSLPLAAAATAIAGLGWGVFLVADWAIACRILPAGALATTMGIWNLALIVPQIVAPALTTFVLQRCAATAGPLGPKIAFALALAETLAGIAWLQRLPGKLTGE